MVTIGTWKLKVAMVVLYLPLTLACGALIYPPTQMQTPFNSAEHRPYLEAGEYSIQGQAFLNQQGGGVVTCAGTEVLLVPATTFFREAVNSANSFKTPQTTEKIDRSFRTTIRSSQCDAQGNFSFQKIPKGSWFIITEVFWRAGGSLQGDVLLKEITPSEQATKVLLAQNDRGKYGTLAKYKAVFNSFFY